MYLPDVTEHMGCFTGGNGVRDMKSKNKGEDVNVIMNALQINSWGNGIGYFQLCWPEMIVAVLIAELKLR